MLMRRSYKFRLDPSKTQKVMLQVWLDRCRELYNACLEVRKNHWERAKKSISLYDQVKELPEVKRECPEFKEINSQVLQTVPAKLDVAFRAFFRRTKAGQTPGYPRFRSSNRFNSFIHPQASVCKWTEKKVYLPCFGWVRWKPWKDLDTEGITPKTLTFKKEADGWYCIVSCEVEQPQPLESTGKHIGIDLGLHHLVATSDGDFLGNLEPIKRQEKRIRKLQSIAEKRKKSSHRRRKAVDQIAKAHQHLERSKKAQLDIISRNLVNENDLIAVEDLEIAQLINLQSLTPTMTRGIHRNFRLASLGLFTHMITYKAEEAGRLVIRVNPRGTSQECSTCGQIVPKDLSVRVHKCPYCGLGIDRDTNAAKNILKRTASKKRVPPAPVVPRDYEDQLRILTT